MTRHDKLFNNIVLPIYFEMYLAAEPSIDFNKILEEEVTNSNWFMDYYLDQKTQDEIIDWYIKRNKSRYKLTKREVRLINNTVNLGCSPRSIKGDSS